MGENATVPDGRHPSQGTVVARIRPLPANQGHTHDALGETWKVDFDLEDGSIVNSKEQTTKFTGQRRVAVDGNFLVLASFSRRSREKAKREVTGFGKIPMVGSAFRKSTAQRANRSFMILARALPERPAMVSKVPALPLPTEP